MLVDAQGRPVSSSRVYAAPSPNPDMEARVNAKLAADFDPLLHIAWCPTAYWNAEKQRLEGRYALYHRWRDNDPRWAGQPPDYPDAHDLMGWFCTDMHDASTVAQEPEQMFELVRTLLGKADNTRFPWKERMLKSIDHNRKLREQARAEAVDEAVDEAAHAYYRSNRAARVFQTGGSK